MEENRQKLIKELSEILDLPITDIVAYLQNGEYHWNISIGEDEVLLRAWQMMTQPSFNRGIVKKTLLISKNQPRGTWLEILRKFIAAAKRAK